MRDCVLSQQDTERLVTCLDAIADESTPARWAALDQLRYFVDGASPALLEVIGGKRFATCAGRRPTRTSRTRPPPPSQPAS